MKQLWPGLILFFLLAGCNQEAAHKNAQKSDRVMIEAEEPKHSIENAANPNGLSVTSPDFQNHGTLPLKLACKKQGGKNVMPTLNWTNVPPGTQSLALSITDPDAPNGHWVHWLVYNIPSNATTLNAQILTYAIQTKNSWDNAEYDGPCPPAGKLHHYVFTLYAFTEMFQKIPLLTLSEFNYVVTQSNAVIE